jgi:hypothetical protein
MTKEVREAGEDGGQIIGDAITEILLVAVASHVGEGPYCDRGLVGQSESRSLGWRNGCRRRRGTQREVLHHNDRRGADRDSGY